MLIVATCVEITSLRQDKRMVPASSDFLQRLPSHISHQSRRKRILSAPMPQLPVCSVPKRVQHPFIRHDQTVMPASLDFLNLNRLLMVDLEIIAIWSQSHLQRQLHLFRFV